MNVINYHVDFKCDELDSDRVVVEAFTKDRENLNDRGPTLALRKFGVQGRLTRLTYHTEPTPEGGMYHGWSFKIG